MNNIANKPYLDGLLESLDDTKSLIKALENRIRLFESPDSIDKPFWEYNEMHILSIKTKAEIKALERVLEEKTKYFEKYSVEFEKRIKLMELNYDETLKRAIELKQTNPVLRIDLENVNWDNVDKSIEVKVHLYERLKKIIG